MLRLIFISFFWFIQFLAFGQNLVPNHSFEINTDCPDARGQIYHASPWERVNNGTTDYYHPCALVPAWSVPANNYGYQYAADGDAYVGFRLYDTEWGANYREYAGVKLISPLQNCMRYRLSFKVSFAYDNKTKWATDDIGATVVNYPGQNVNLSTQTVLTYQPVVENIQGNIITDSSGWVLISGEFIAAGGEQYLIIGNFKDDANTTALDVFPQKFYGTSYYYMDEVILEQIPSVDPDLGIDTTICEAFPLELSLAGVWDQIQWNDGTLGNPFTIASSGLYWVNASIHGCNFSDSIFVETDVAPLLVMPSDTVICTGESIEISPISDNGYYWLHNNESSPISISDSGTYTAVTQNGVCFIEKSIRIEHEDCLFVPNIFSPNNDGENDMLFVRGVSGRELVFEIYNRWGQLVFRTTDDQIGWDGTHKGQNAEQGVYMFQVILKNEGGNDSVIGGDVTLVR